MNELLIATRALLDALTEHHDALILIGAQVVHLRPGAAAVALAEATKDSDLAIDPRELKDDPRSRRRWPGPMSTGNLEVIRPSWRARRA